jgi:hypothetical protein
MSRLSIKYGILDVSQPYGGNILSDIKPLMSGQRQSNIHYIVKFKDSHWHILDIFLRFGEVAELFGS